MYSIVPSTCPNSVNMVRVGQGLTDSLGHAKVDDFGHGSIVVIGHQHVRGLQIAVDDSLLMGVLHRLEQTEMKQLESLLRCSACADRNSW